MRNLDAYDFATEPMERGISVPFGSEATMNVAIMRLDPFRDAVPCWHSDWYWPTAKERRAGRLAADLELRKSIGRA